MQKPVFTDFRVFEISEKLEPSFFLIFSRYYELRDCPPAVRWDLTFAGTAEEVKAVYIPVVGKLFDDTEARCSFIFTSEQLADYMEKRLHKPESLSLAALKEIGFDMYTVEPQHFEFLDDQYDAADIENMPTRVIATDAEVNQMVRDLRSLRCAGTEIRQWFYDILGTGHYHIPPKPPGSGSTFTSEPAI